MPTTHSSNRLPNGIRLEPESDAERLVLAQLGDVCQDKDLYVCIERGFNDQVGLCDGPVKALTIRVRPQ